MGEASALHQRGDADAREPLAAQLSRRRLKDALTHGLLVADGVSHDEHHAMNRLASMGLTAKRHIGLLGRPTQRAYADPCPRAAFSRRAS